MQRKDKSTSKKQDVKPTTKEQIDLMVTHLSGYLKTAYLEICLWLCRLALQSQKGQEHKFWDVADSLRGFGLDVRNLEAVDRQQWLAWGDSEKHSWIGQLFFLDRYRDEGSGRILDAVVEPLPHQSGYRLERDYTTNQAAVVLGISERTLHYRLRKGEYTDADLGRVKKNRTRTIFDSEKVVAVAIKKFFDDRYRK